MKREQWQEVEKIYDAAVELDQEHRARFLDSACDGNEELKREVQSLLQQEGKTEDFLESPALEVAAKGMAQDKAKGQTDPLIGQEFSSYRTVSLLGSGGMGQVYLAEDRSLDRKVALKFLPEDLQQDDTARKRFLREAKSAAALDHPYICKIYEVGESDGKDFISMEYMAGETLANRLDRGPIPLKEALQKAIEIAEALEAARQRKIVHRDLKPANIMLTLDGHVKVMDFGLAKRVGGDGHDDTTTLTRPGTTVGTMAYMSPEQLRGEQVDPRSDIFCFGIVLYEMLSGVHPFMKPKSVEILSAILKEDPPPITRYLDEVPSLLQHTVRKMLAKEPNRRYQSIHEVATDLREVMHATFGSVPTTSDLPAASVQETEPVPKPAWRGMGPWGVAAVLGGALLISLFALWQSTLPVEQIPVRLHVQLPAEQSLHRGDPSSAVLSPDGKRLAYIAGSGQNRRLYTRTLDQEVEATPLRGTGGARSPFFSPDGQWVGFSVEGGGGGTLKKISVLGGSAVTLCDRPAYNGASWGSDGTIIFSPGSTSGLWRVSASGSTPEQITVLDAEKGEDSHRHPWFLPDGRSVLFSAGRRSEFTQATIEVLSLETGERRIVHQGGYFAGYSPTGHLVFMQEDTLFAAPFDLDRLELTGSPVPVVDGVWTNFAGDAQLDFSQTGTLLYLRGGETIGTRNVLVWADREGKEELLDGEPRGHSYVRISPEGGHAAVGVDADIWIYDLVRETRTRLTFDPAGDGFPLWTRDGQRVVFSSFRDRGGLFWRSADGTDQTKQLAAPRVPATSGRFGPIAHFFSPDEKKLVVDERGEDRNVDLFVLSMEEGEPRSQPLLRTPSREEQAALSPDGRWMAYESDESGQYDVYVRPFPNVDEGMWQISVEGGRAPVWGPQGGELFYHSGQALMVVRVETESNFTHGSPQVLFPRNLPNPWRSYDVHPDGQRFLMIKGIEQRDELIVVLNWFEELKRLVLTE